MVQRQESNRSEGKSGKCYITSHCPLSSALAKITELLIVPCCPLLKHPLPGSTSEIFLPRVTSGRFLVEVFSGGRNPSCPP